MKIKFTAFFLTLFVAALVLLVSLVSSSSLEYEFELEPIDSSQATPVPGINYQLPYPGRIQPTNLFWPAKVVRDKLVLAMTRGELEKAKVSLLLADKRLASGAILTEQGKYEEAAEVFKKSQMYLDYSCRLAYEAYGEEGEASFPPVLALASLKHREVLEKSITRFPEDARPVISEILNGPKQVFEKTSQLINESGLKAPANPFEK